MLSTIKDIIERIQEFMPTIEYKFQRSFKCDKPYYIKDGVNFRKDILYIEYKGVAYKFKLVKNNPKGSNVTTYEIELCRKLWEELLPCLEDDNTSLKNLSPYYIQLAICQFLNTQANNYVRDSKKLNLLLNNLDIWSQRTYEGENVELVFVLPKHNTENVDTGSSVTVVNNMVNINDVIMKDFIAPLTSIGHSAILLDYDCNIMRHLSVSNVANKPDCPVPYQIDHFIKYLQKEFKNCLVVALIENGDILLIRNGILQFARRRGQWHIFNDTILDYLMGGKGELPTKLYNAIIDASFAHTGACICVWDMDSNNLTEDDVKSLSSVINLHDIYNVRVKSEVERYMQSKGKKVPKDEQEPKRKAIRQIIGADINITKSFSRKKLQELLGIDGATVIDKNGDIIAVGAIVRVSGGSESGARLAAALSLSKYGLAIKVSEDGKITAYKKEFGKSPILNLG